MPATSPYQNNDYNAAQFRPAKLPIADIFKGIQTKNAYWNIKASQIKSQYDSAFGMELTLDENKQALKQHLDNAREQLKKMNTMDLTNPDVAKQSASLLQPIQDDENLKMDSYLTGLQKQVFQDAQSYKVKDEGKAYSDTNLQYALMPFEGFNSQLSRNDLKSVYAKAKNAAYTPYYNVQDEYLKIAGKCTPDKVAKTSVSQLYLVNSEDNSQTASNLTGCLKSGLSEKAWNQMRIEGSVRYHGNVQGLGMDYVSTVDSDNKAYAESIAELVANKKKLKDAKQLTPEVEQAISDNISQINTRINENNKLTAQVRAGDYSTIQNNFEKYATLVYGNNDISSYAVANSFVDRKENISANPVGVMQYKMQNDNYWKQKEMQNENYWNGLNYGLKQEELEQKKQKDNMDIIMSLMGGKDGSASSGLGGLGGQFATEMFLKMAGQYGIDLNDLAPVAMSTGTVEETGYTVDYIKDQANKFHQERINSGVGIYNILSGLFGKDGKQALDKIARGNNGQVATNDTYDLAQKILANYDKPEADRDNTLPKLTGDEISRLRDEVNNYSNLSAKVFDFIHMRDEADKVISSNPELLKSKKDYDAYSSEVVNKLTHNGTSQVVLLSPALGKNVAFDKNKLERIFKGYDEDFKLINKDGEFGIVNKKTGDLLRDAGQREITGIGLTGFERDWRGGSPIGFNPNLAITGAEFPITGAIKSVSDKYKEYSTKMSEGLTGALSKVIKNKETRNLANIPGISNSLKQNFTNIPQLNSPNVILKLQGNAIPNADGTARQEVKFFEYDPKEKVEGKEIDYKTVLGYYEKNPSIAPDNTSKVSFDGEKITVDVSNLPFFNKPYELQDVIDSKVKFIESYKKLENQQTENVELKSLPGGAKVGFKVRGRGMDLQGRTTNDYIPYVQFPNGDVREVGSATNPNQIGNVLKGIEDQLKRMQQ